MNKPTTQHFLVEVLMEVVLSYVVLLAPEVGWTAPSGTEESPQSYELLIPATWRAQEHFSLSWKSNYTENIRGMVRADHLAATAYVDFSSRVKPHSAALVAEYRYSRDRDDMGLLAGVISRRISAWTLSAGLILKKAASSSSQWRYSARARYRFRQHHRLSMELLGPLGDSGPSKLMLGYDWKPMGLSSLNISVGIGSDSTRNSVARTALTWRFR